MKLNIHPFMSLYITRNTKVISKTGEENFIQQKMKLNIHFFISLRMSKNIKVIIKTEKKNESFYLTVVGKLDS